MSRGFTMTWERHPQGFPFQGSVEEVRDSGLSLESPTDGGIRVWTDDGEDRLAASVGALARLAGSANSITFQFWFRRDADLGSSLCRLRDDVYRVTFDFDGLTPTEELRVRDLALARFVAPSQAESALALVVDRRGVTEDYDWDGFVLESKAAPTVLGTHGAT